MKPSEIITELDTIWLRIVRLRRKNKNVKWLCCGLMAAEGLIIPTRNAVKYVSEVSK